MRTPITVARELVGAWLCRRLGDGRVVRARICELELYTMDERGCHAYAGRRTARNDAMFLCGGHAYVYLCYGMYDMLNIVLGADGFAAAVLIRAVEINGGNGPGRLTRTLGITRRDNKCDLCAENADIWIEARNTNDTPNIVQATRIGIDYAGGDAKLPWRFLIRTSPFVSKGV